MARHVIAADVVITTAAIFGMAPPLLIPQEVVDQLKSGDVIVDMAADETAGRGNCQATQPGRVITTDRHAVIDGTLNLPAHAPIHATQMFASNMLAFLKEIVGKDGDKLTLKLNLEDEIQKGACIVHDGRIVNDMVGQAALGVA